MINTSDSFDADAAPGRAAGFKIKSEEAFGPHNDWGETLDKETYMALLHNPSDQVVGRQPPHLEPRPGTVEITRPTDSEEAHYIPGITHPHSAAASAPSATPAPGDDIWDPIHDCDDLPPALRFDPVPVQHRKDGWIPSRQRNFILALSHTGCVVAATKAVGMSFRNAYRLRSHPEAGEFNAAWEAALQMGTATLEGILYDRAINGVATPVLNKEGDAIYMHQKFSDGLLMFLLRARKPEVYSLAAQRNRADRFHSMEQRHLYEQEKAERERRNLIDPGFDDDAGRDEAEEEARDQLIRQALAWEQIVDDAERAGTEPDISEDNIAAHVCALPQMDRYELHRRSMKLLDRLDEAEARWDEEKRALIEAGDEEDDEETASPSAPNRHARRAAAKRGKVGKRR